MANGWRRECAGMDNDVKFKWSRSGRERRGMNGDYEWPVLPTRASRRRESARGEWRGGAPGGKKTRGRTVTARRALICTIGGDLSG